MKKNKISALAVAAILSMGMGLPSESPPTAPFFNVCEAASYIDASIRPIQLSFCNHHTVDADEESTLLHSSMTTVTVISNAGAEGFKALEQALWEYSETKIEEANSAREKLLAQAKQDRVERSDAFPFLPYESINELCFRRSDTLAVSLLEYHQSYEGGVHGMSTVVGKTFDAKTGKELSLFDVCTDMDGLKKAVQSAIRLHYPNAAFVSVEDDGTIHWQTVDVDEMIENGSIPWTLDPCGVSFYFNPYIIAPYAEGICSVTLLFDEHPGLFKDPYHHAPTSYCMELFPYIPVQTSFADGSSARINIMNTDSSICIDWNGTNFDDTDNMYDLRPVLVSTEDGRRYLYVDGMEAGDLWETTHIYDVNEDMPFRIHMAQRMTRRANVSENFTEPPSGIMDKSFHIMTDPEHFWMTLLDAKTEKARPCNCRVGANGLPEIIEMPEVMYMPKTE